MKTSIVSLAVAFLVSIVSFGFTKPLHQETATFKVYGNCGMCKSRIESALKIDGVSKAGWDVKTKMLTITYNPHVLSLDDIHKKIAAVGHDTDKVKADDKTYANLMECCQYERKK